MRCATGFALPEEEPEASDDELVAFRDDVSTEIPGHASPTTLAMIPPDSRARYDLDLSRSDADMLGFRGFVGQGPILTAMFPVAISR